MAAIFQYSFALVCVMLLIIPFNFITTVQARRVFVNIEPKSFDQLEPLSASELGLNLISKLNQINLNDLSSTVGTDLFANGIVKLFQQGIYINTTTIIQEELMNEISRFIENLPLKTVADAVIEIDANFNINELSATGSITTNKGLVFIYNDAIFIKILVAKYFNIDTFKNVLSYLQQYPVYIQKLFEATATLLRC